MGMEAVGIAASPPCGFRSNPLFGAWRDPDASAESVRGWVDSSSVSDEGERDDFFSRAGGGRLHGSRWPSAGPQHYPRVDSSDEEFGAMAMSHSGIIFPSLFR